MSTLARPASRVALDAVVADALVHQHEVLHHRGIELRQHLRPVEVWAEVGALTELVSAALDWSGTPGTRLLVRVELQNWPEHGLLGLRATSAVHVAGEPPIARETSGAAWERLRAAAEAAGARLRHSSTADHVDLTLEFPRTVKLVSPLTALDVDRLIPHDTVRMTTAAHPIAGARVLLVTDDAELGAAVRAVCLRLDLQLQRAADSRKAVSLCELSLPDLIIIDAALNDAGFRQLHADLLREEIHFPVIEVAREATIPEIASWEGCSIGRIGRDAVASQLPSALAMALVR